MSTASDASSRASATALSVETMPDVYRFRVEGSEQQRTYLPTQVASFDETFELEGEHPAEALRKLLNEIEWGILDSDEPFTISYLGDA